MDVVPINREQSQITVSSIVENLHFETWMGEEISWNGLSVDEEVHCIRDIDAPKLKVQRWSAVTAFEDEFSRNWIWHNHDIALLDCSGGDVE